MPLVTKPNVNKPWAVDGVKLQPSDAKTNLGWVVERPPHQYQNYLQNNSDTFLKHVNQAGIPEWDAVTEYTAGKSYVQGSNGTIYVATANGSGFNPVTATAQWTKALLSPAEMEAIRLQALGFAEDAEYWAGQAQLRATAAQTSATNAAASATAASGSASSASASASAADASKVAAATSEANALAYRNTASTHATNAGTSASNAANSAGTATVQAGTATSQASLANTRATAAQTSATNASSSATGAQTSATNAASSATSASTSATTATNQAALALTRANAAQTSADAAAQSAIDSAAAVGSAMQKTGDTMTGNLNITKSNPMLSLNSAAGAATISASLAGVTRWAIYLADTTAANFLIQRFNSSGGAVGSAFAISGVNGVVSSSDNNANVGVADSSAALATTGWVRTAMSNIASTAGFVVMQTTPGYMRFPSWFGGLIIQWGTSISNTNSDSVLTASYPITFPNQIYTAVAVNGDTNASTPRSTVALTNLSRTEIGMVISSPANGGGNAGPGPGHTYRYNWIAIGR